MCEHFERLKKNDIKSISLNFFSSIIIAIYYKCIEQKQCISLLLLDGLQTQIHSYDTLGENFGENAVILIHCCFE